MRRVGRVSDWNDDRGYGFVVPHDGGARAFVHVRAFQPGSRRPVAGDLISYEVRRDAKGRSNASNVRFAGQRIETRAHAPRRALPIPRRLLAALFAAGVGVAAALGIVPVIVPLAYGVLAIASYLAYWWDKEAASRGARRTPEATLHLLDLLGGWPGALIAQQQYRHKTVKGSFQLMFWFTVLANLAAVAWLTRTGVAAAMGDVLPGG